MRSHIVKFGQAVSLVCTLSGCGIYVPDKSPLISGEPDLSSRDGASPQAKYEDTLVVHVNCELAKALVDSVSKWDSPWLVSDTIGTSITLTITALQQGGINAGASLTRPFLNGIKVAPTASGGNVVTAQSFSLGLGATAAANSSRTETIQWTQKNSDLRSYYYNHRIKDCADYQKGILIDSNLKIGDFVDDNARLARLNNLSASLTVPTKFVARYGTDISRVPIYNTFTDELNFVSAFGGSLNPTWKFVDVTANTPGNLLGVQNTYTNDLIVTIGQLKQGAFPYQLDANGQTQHQTRVNANAIATSIQNQMH